MTHIRCKTKITYGQTSFPFIKGFFQTIIFLREFKNFILNSLLPVRTKVRITVQSIDNTIVYDFYYSLDYSLK